MKLQKNINKSTFLIILFIYFVSIFAKSSIESPISGTIYKNSETILEVKTDSKIDSIIFSIQYRTKRGSLMSKRVGSISTPPYRIVWNSKVIPNQYYYGAKAIAEIYKSNRKVEILENKRIYLLPHPIITSKIPLYPSGYSDSIISFINDSTKIGELFFNYNDSLLNIKIQYTPSKSDSETVTVILDPKLEKLPYTNNSTTLLKIDKERKAQLVTTYIDTSNNEFQLSRTGSKISINNSFTTDSTGKRTINIAIPTYLLGGKIPERVGVNIVIPYNGKELSLVDGGQQCFYSPITYPTLIKSNIPEVVKVSAVKSFLITFSIGALLSLIGIIFYIFYQKKNEKKNIEFHHNIKAKLYKLDVLITDPLLTNEVASKKLNISISDLNKLCHNEVGKSFINYVKWCRVEIAKERLISSKASEIAIAQDCGFASITDMENSFHALTGIAPYQFRDKNGVN